MTQPNSINQTFDTSLVDLKNTSFSTTESDSSTSASAAHPTTSTPAQQHQETPSTQEPPHQSASTPNAAQVKHLPTQLAYDQWADIYDTDGNMLQAIDDIEVAALLPSFLLKVRCNNSSNDHGNNSGPPADAGTAVKTLSLIDLGCGTGRNTAKLLTTRSTNAENMHVTGLDFSAGMLQRAKANLEGLTGPSRAIKLEHVDCFPSAADAAASPKPAIDIVPVSGLISTLVLEHIPLRPFFATVAALLAPGGYALVSNMHGDMGRVSQAGFVDAQGVKVRGTSYAHTVQETFDEAVRAGFEVASVRERAVEMEDVVEGRVGERGKKWVGVRVWYGIVVRKVGVAVL